MTADLISTAIGQYGAIAYLLFFFLILIETGLVFMPFLPGDSLLFMSGALLAQANLSLSLVICAFSLAAIVGDFVNYSLGRRYGARLLKTRLARRFVKPNALARAETFFAKYGNSAISLGRFVPIVRTMIPFTAGMGKMARANFICYNVLGGICWVTIGILAGHFFGKVPVVRAHFELLMVAIVLVSVLPLAIAKFTKRGRA